ncbi:MAG TPA: phage holin family protein [Holophagaceae bacterium]|jgi:putative membrane protein|nr:phage holin family protein [Holophagaceae bacterium]
MHTLLRFLFSALGLLVAAAFVPGVHGGPFLELVVVAIILGALNATLGLLLKFIAFLPNFCTFGCLGLLINGLVFWLAGSLSSALGLHFRVSGFWAGFWGALVSSAVAGILGWIFLPKKDKGGRGDEPRKVKVINP